MFEFLKKVLQLGKYRVEESCDYQPCKQLGCSQERVLGLNKCCKCELNK